MKQKNKDQFFEQIYAAYADPIYRTCCSFVRDEADRKDLFQEIFSNIWKGLDRLKNKKALKTWTYRVSQNTAIAFVVKRRKTSFQSEEGLENQPTTDEKDLSAKLVHEQQLDLMYSQIATLPPTDRSIISMVLEDLNQSEIARILGLSEGNVRVRIHRIKKTLKNKMEETYEL